MKSKLKLLIPAIAALAAAPFVSAGNANLLPDESVAVKLPMESSAPAKTEKIKISPEQRTLFLQGLGWLVAQQSGLIEDLRVSKEDTAAIAEGFKLALQGEGNDIPTKILADNAAYSQFIDELQEQAIAAMEAEMKQAAEGNRKIGAEFVAKTKAEDKSFVTLPSGVLMKTTKAGDASKKPTLKDTVSVRYTGKLVDGTIFDSSNRSEDRVPVQFVAGEGDTVELPLGGLIPAWGEALPLIGVGGQCTLIIPADQAYGDRATGIIPPGSTLIFDIELDGIADPEEDDDESVLDKDVEA